MRVHHIISDYSKFTGGAQRVVRSLHLGLKDRGVESHILGIMQQQDPDLDDSNSLGLSSPYDLRALMEINRYIKEHVQKGDVVHAHLFPPLFFVSFLKPFQRKDIHLVGTEHSTSNRRRNTLLGRMIDGITYRGYEQVVAISTGVEQELVKWKPALCGKTRVIHNGVDLPFIRSPKHPNTGRLKVLSVGNLRPAKNYANALNAVSLLKEMDFEYQIAGEGKLQAELVQLANDLGIANKVSFLGYIDSVYEFFATADIFLMPSLWEGFGLAAVEAMNAGLPLIVSDVPGLRELVDGEDPCALLVDPESVVSIADGLRQLLQSSQMRQQLGGQAFEVSQKFSIEKMVTSHISFYEQFC